jgi:hypothetical protein
LKNFGPPSIKDVNAAVLYDSWVKFIAPDDITGVPGAVPRRRRNLTALMKKTIAPRWEFNLVRSLAIAGRTDE